MFSSFISFFLTIAQCELQRQHRQHLKNDSFQTMQLFLLMTNFYNDYVFIAAGIRVFRSIQFFRNITGKKSQMVRSGDVAC